MSYCLTVLVVDVSELKVGEYVVEKIDAGQRFVRTPAGELQTTGRKAIYCPILAMFEMDKADYGGSLFRLVSDTEQDKEFDKTSCYLVHPPGSQDFAVTKDCYGESLRFRTVQQVRDALAADLQRSPGDFCLSSLYTYLTTLQHCQPYCARNPGVLFYGH